MAHGTGIVRRRPVTSGLLVGFVGLCCVGGSRAGEPTGKEVDFNREVRPILSGHCYACHGPDASKRKAKLRLDTEAGTLADLGGRRAVAPGDPEASELVLRITSDDESDRMPPAKGGRPLTPTQIDTLRRWVAQGAHWREHWAFVPPQRVGPPAARNEANVRNPIDAFVLARLGKEGLSPSPEADRASLLRRVTLDLTGLPPDIAAIDAFLGDKTPGAYDRVVDRLLGSPRFGERMAARWLDAARYADTNGYQSDGERSMWRWRDWVIEALNQKMPFDRFTLEQIAGDLLPNPTLEQRIATGFNRNHRGNAEGGIIPEEYAVEYVADRVETTATVWLGLTIGCARCHDHKFDPLVQRDYYRLFAYFNNVPEKGRAVKFGNSPPLIKAPTPRQQASLAELDQRLAAAETRFEARRPELDRAQAAWEAEVRRGGPLEWVDEAALLGRITLDGTAEDRVATRGGEPSFVPGRVGKAIELDGKTYIDAGDIGAFGFDDKFTLTAWIDGNRGTVVSRMTDADEADGYAVVVSDGRVRVHLVKRWLDDAMRVVSDRVLTTPGWRHLAVTYDGSRVASGVRLYVDGRPQPLHAELDELNQSFRSTEPLRIGGGNGPEGRFQGRIDETRVYGRVLSPDEAAAVATPESIADIVAITPERRTSGQVAKVRACFLDRFAPEDARKAWTDLRALRAERVKMIESFPTTMVMEEMPTPRPSHILTRGQYDRPGERVGPGVPDVLSPSPPGAEGNRIGLARWLVDARNPLTPRVAVNRLWQMLFGAGLVRSAEDFGVQGEPPTHPELLDWLAAELVARDWDLPALLRMIVTSSTYRRSSRVTEELRKRDPDNRLLTRGPRIRLSAEMVRDQALAASGLLVERVGGPSVKPYQPEGLWRELAEIKEYPQDHGPNLYRRGLYTFWKRTVAPPSMAVFDAAGREACSVRESRTNTPLQALTLLNDVTYVEAARALAQRARREAGAGSEPDAWLALAFRLVTARPPEAAELQMLTDGYRAHLAHYRADPAAARRLIQIGESTPDASLDPAELAAASVVCELILNLDESITKE